ncbi:MadC family VWA domain-containing protein [Gordonia sp. (in: high G+C Gram-positive bacteria)]|uniref:MadC family VWA domain-containing protein n=1 Tax=Gordonia sp. (in: high G+C Gram-positive bacteria) TaxID=84139 RepID=UPI003C722474
MMSTAAFTRRDVLDGLAVQFGRALRAFGLAVSPAEVIEIRRTLALVGGGNPRTLKTALRSVSVKYTYEQQAFDAAYAVFFEGADPDEASSGGPLTRGLYGELPLDVEWDDEFSGVGRMIGADEHSFEIGELMVDDPDARERHAESAHRENDDFSVSSGSEQLEVGTDESVVSGGVTYTVEVDHADTAQVGELVGATARVEGTALRLADAAALLAALDSTDARAAYGADGAEGLDEHQMRELEQALARFVDALSERLAAAEIIEQHVVGAHDGRAPTHRDQADIDRACHRLVQRMRGAPRRVPRETDKGRLDIRQTMRAAVATDGVPVALWRRRAVPGPVRTLVMVDVSISVRPVAGFILRLAQTLHRFGDRCEVVAFVDQPVLVTSALRTSNAEGALAAVLATEGLDLAATSDYGRMWTAMLERYGDLVTKKTNVLIVGDARSNAFDPLVEKFAELARRSNRVAWLTPEPSRYWSQTGCALADYAEYCDGVVSARDGAEILARCDELGAALR